MFLTNLAVQAMVDSYLILVFLPRYLFASKFVRQVLGGEDL